MTCSKGKCIEKRTHWWWLLFHGQAANVRCRIMHASYHQTQCCGVENCSQGHPRLQCNRENQFCYLESKWRLLFCVQQALQAPDSVLCCLLSGDKRWQGKLCTSIYGGPLFCTHFLMGARSSKLPQAMFYLSQRVPMTIGASAHHSGESCITPSPTTPQGVRKWPATLFHAILLVFGC